MSAEVVVFPDVVEAVTLYLRGELAGRGFTTTVATDVPTTRPAELVRVLRTGGVHHADPGVPVEQAQITVECWAQAGQGDAHDLAQLCRALLFAARGVVEGVLFCRAEEIAGPAYLPDPLSDDPRYTLTVLLTVRGDPEAGS